ncbi:MAG: UDP-glucose 4-epimerase GalE [Parachlamydiales bacterium]|nr:UDP-glucose 4-epimerase GalE [Candidatus Acheromyda pituitae]
MLHRCKLFILIILLSAKASAWTAEPTHPSKTVLVTGGAGYIGSQTCKALRQAGYLPIAYDNLSNGHREQVQWGPLEVGDVSDREMLKEVIARYRPIAVIHLAALKSVGESVKDPAKYYFNNVYGSLVLLDTLKEMGIHNVIFSSTASVYGIPDTPVITENNAVQPINTYGHTKAMVEQIMKDFDKAYGIHFISLRFFNAAGADLDAEIGERGSVPINLIPIALRVAAKQQKSLAIFGTDFDTPDGTAIRDYIHVVDLADAHVKALQYLLDGSPSAIMNLGTGIGSSVHEVVSEIKQISQRLLPTELAPRREGDPPRLVADAKKAKELLNWKPKHSTLKTIITTEWNWLCKLYRNSLKNQEFDKEDPQNLHFRGNDHCSQARPD